MDEAVDAWNTRHREASTADLRAENERLSAVIDSLHKQKSEVSQDFSAVVAEAVIHKKARIVEIEQLRESLRWAIAEIEGATRYERDDQFDNCLKIARAVLSPQPSEQDAADDTGISCEACAGSIADGEDHVSYKDGIALCSKCAAADVD